MKWQGLGAAVGIGAIALAYGVWRTPRVAAPIAAPAPELPAAKLPPAPLLEFSEFFQPGAELKPSAKLLSLNGQRVHIVGFMAQLEIAPTGAFYLVPMPVRCDEAGGGTADLPLESVLVLSASAAGHEVPFLRGKLDVSGVLEVGNVAGADGRMSAFRLHLDPGGTDPASPETGARKPS